LAINLVIGHAMPLIDNAAHIGGLVAGAVCGVLMSHPLDRTTKASRAVHNVSTAAVGVLALLSASTFAPQAPVDFAGIHGKVFDIYTPAAIRRDHGEITDDELADIVESDVLPPWRDMRQQLDETPLPSGRREQRAIVRRDYVKAREEHWEALVAYLREPNAASITEFDRKSAAADALLRKLNDG